jgi:prolyl 3-hydroxylase /prolyl 3,4-dihydroxylase
LTNFISGSTEEDIEKRFRKKLFLPQVLKQYREEYANSEPYKHAVIRELIDDSLLRNVRSEIKENVHFTPKETDIYKIHQSGDLANLDGLDDAALSKLPSLLKLRDALYSPAFRRYVAEITNAGELSGRKTDMAINVYTLGCHLLCHDDVIGSRRVSYILYLTDPDIPWQEEWGGALRLYPTSIFEGDDGGTAKVPSPDFSKSIPPTWNQLSFFAVQPGESFHDVEEVYHAPDQEQLEKDGGRIRMAISGWYHIPQIGEDGYVEGLEEKLAEKSSLVQLQGKADRYDFPQEQVMEVETTQKAENAGLEAADIDFLLKYLAPTYLTPDTMEQVTEHFTDQSSVILEGILSPKFASRLRSYIESQESTPPSATTSETESKTSWKVARPPHKHRFLYLQTLSQVLDDEVEDNPIKELLDDFLPSREFRQWLELVTECEIENFSVMGRRFRRGKDYALATSHEGKPRLELCLGMTRTKGWGDDEDEDEGGAEDPADAEDEEREAATSSSSTMPNGTSKAKDKGKSRLRDITATLEAEEKQEDIPLEDTDDVGAQEIYMATDDSADDAAVYKTSTSNDDDNILFTSPASWNKLTLVLRDSGVLKFVKYVSAKAQGDRWDAVGVYGVKDDDDGDDDSEAGPEIGDEDEEAETDIEGEDDEVGKASERTKEVNGGGLGESSSQSQSQSQSGSGSGSGSQSQSLPSTSFESFGKSDSEEEEFRGFPDSGDDSESD